MNENVCESFWLPAKAAAELEAQQRFLESVYPGASVIFPDKNGEQLTHRVDLRRFHTCCAYNGIEPTASHELRYMRHSMNRALPPELVKHVSGPS